jgi:hypothetical protein
MIFARSGTTVADEKAYGWGKRGVSVTPTLLRNRLREHNGTELQHRAETLHRRIHGRGASTHHISAIVLGLAVFVIALFVDYNIIHEFWTRALANEFMEVPPALATSVTFKSLQVLFATLAIHYLISHIGHGGRIAYSLFIFAITAAMVMGIGLLWANNSLPAGAKVFGFDVNESAQQVDAFMKSLGVAPPRKPVVPAEVKELKKYEIIIWLFSLGVIFLVVASIGAMSLHTAMRGFAGITGGALYDNNHDARHGNAMRDNLRRAELDRQHHDNDQEAFFRRKIGDFLSSYTEGVIDGHFSAGRTDHLITKATEAASEVETNLSDLATGSSGSSTDNVEPLHHRRRAATG